MIIERFAPSPTGLLHLGHAYSAWVGWSAAHRAGGKFLLRLEDLDQSRVRPEYDAAIQRDLSWLGLDWDGPILRQSQRTAAYGTVLADLAARGLTYRCVCTRRDISDAIDAPQELGPDGPVYPGTCRGRHKPGDQPHAIRLDMARAISTLGPLAFTELGHGPDGQTGTIQIDPQALVETVGDVILARRDGAIAYHLAVVVDDAFQQITHVSRGQDLFAATQIHHVLQALLDLPAPVYRHHRLVRDTAGKRLAKRDDARAIAAYREQGLGPAEVLAMAGVSDHFPFGTRD